MKYTFSDEVLLELFRRVQLAMFTNTDVVDNMRRMELETNTDGTLVLTEDYKTLTTEEVNRYIKQASAAMDALRPDKELLPDIAKALV